MDTTPVGRPRSLKPFDFHHEKVALTQMAHWLIEQGWIARLSVRPDQAFADGDLGGVPPLPLDDEFEARFNSPDKWRYRYTFYRDQPGNFDLVARKGGETLIVEGKGRSASNRRGAVAQMIGSLVLTRRTDREAIRYAVVLPNDSSWDPALRNTGDLEWLELFRIDAARPGTITRDDWARYRTEESAPA